MTPGNEATNAEARVRAAAVEAQRPWYAEVTRYQWLVLVIASLGWVFDIFENQVFLATSNEALPALTHVGPDDSHAFLYINIALGAFLAGGALGGIGFGMLSDRIGRVRTMMLTILWYSLFTCLIALVQSWTQLVVLFFLVSLGTGGEWAVASAMVAEVFPSRARAHSMAIFQGSSVLGAWAAVAVGWWIVPNPHLGWRWGYVVGVVPALLAIWVYRSLREPEQWRQAKAAAQASGQRSGRLRDLFAPGLAYKTVIGLALATVGLATYWGVFANGRQILRGTEQRQCLAQLESQCLAELGRAATPEERQTCLADHSGSIKRAEMAGMFLVTFGGGLGIIGFGPICERLRRRGAFVFYTLGGALAGGLAFQYLPGASTLTLCLALPVFGFFTAGMHGGFAVYFPELFPTRLRGTGGGFCFNGGRLLAAPILIFGGWMQREVGSVENLASLLSLLFLAGTAIALLAPETKGRELPT
jgi:MFS family permease